MQDGALTDTKEKILFDTNQLVISLNTQVAVLSNSFSELKKVLEEFIKLENERNEKFDTRLVIHQNDLTRLQTRLDNLEQRVNDLQAKMVWWDVAGIIGAIIAGVIAWFK